MKNQLQFIENYLLSFPAGRVARRWLASVSLFLIMAAVMVLPSVSHAAVITWGGGTITNDSDVLTTGTALYAYDWANSAQTVNGVSFTGSSSVSGAASDVGLTASTGTIVNNTTAFGSGAGSPYNLLSSAYQGIIEGGDYASSASATFTVTLKNLTVGEMYAVQMWVNDTRSGEATRTETVTSSGGNTITLAYNYIQANGGVGQYGIGTFTADGTSQTFTVLGSASTQINALQVRDVTGTGYTPPGPPPAPPVPISVIWNGGSAIDSNWSDATNWTGTTVSNNAYLTATFGGTARQTNTNDLTNLTLSAVTLSTANWNITGNPVTLLGNITASAAGTSTWGLNTALNNTPTVSQSASGDILNLTGVLSGAGGITKPNSASGLGVLQLSNPNNTFTGAVNVQAGTLVYDSLSPSNQPSSLGAGSGNISVGSAGNVAALNYAGSTAGATDRGLTLTGNAVGSVSLNNNSPANAGLTFNADVNFTPANVFNTSLGGSSTGTNTFNGQFGTTTFGGNLQVSGPGTWAFNNIIYLNGNLTVAANGHFVLGYDSSFPSPTLLPLITVNPGSTFDVSSYDQNGQIYTLGSYSGYPETLLAGRTGGTAAPDIFGSLSLGGQGGATLNIAGSSAPGTLTINGNFVPASGILDFDLNSAATAGSGVNDLIQVNGNLDLSQGTANVIVKPLAAIQTNTPYTLISYTGTLNGNASGLSVPSPGRIYSAGQVSAGAGVVTVTFNPSGVPPAGHLLWQGNLSQNWDVDTTANWLNGGNSDYFYNLDNVFFDDSASQFSVNLPGPILAGVITVTNNVNSYTFSGAGAIQSGALVKQGSGTLTLTETGGDNFNGGIAVSNGTVVLDTVNPISASGFSIQSGGILQLGNNDTGGTPSGNIVNNGSLVGQRSDNLNLISIISGSGSVSQSSGGTLTLSGVNTYTGATIINAGTLAIGVTGQLGAGNYTNSLTDNGTFAYGSSLAQTLSGNISGSGALNYTGPGTLTLMGTNTYSGVTTVANGSGSLVITTVTALGTGNVTISKTSTSSGTLVLQTTGVNTFTNTFNGFSSANTFSGGGSATIENAAGSNVITSPLIIASTGGNGVNLQSDAGGFLEVAGAISNAPAVATRSVALGGTGNGLVSGPIVAANGQGLYSEKDGSGTWTLSANNSMNRTMTLNGGTLQLGNGGTAGSLNSQTVAFGGNNTALMFNRSDAPTFSDPINLNGTNELAAANGTTATLTGLIASAATATLLINDATHTGTLILNHANTYTNATVIQAGTLLASGSSLGSGAVTVNGTLSVGKTGSDTTGQSLTLSSSLLVNSGGAVNVDLFSGAGGGDNTGNAAAADVLSVSGSMTLSSDATLNIGNPNALTAWTAGDQWKLANWSSLPAGTFATVNLPALPNGLAWDTSGLYSAGIIKVIFSGGGPTAPANITGVTLVNGALVISGTNLNGGQNFHYAVLTTTNLTLPLTNWTVLSTNAFNADGTFTYTNAVSPASPAMFFDVKAVQ